MKRVSVVKVLAGSGVLGLIAGVVLSEMRGQRLEHERDSAEAQRARKAPSPRPKVYEVAGKTTFVDPEAVKFLPEYPNAVPTDLAEMSASQGVPLKAGMFTTPDPLEKVLAFYETELTRAGRLTVSQHWGTGAAYLGFYGPDKHMHTVALMRSGSQTCVFLANSDPEAFLKGSAQRPDSLPALPQVRGEVSFTFTDEGVKRSTYVANTAAMTLDQTADFYKSQLSASGWRVEENNERQSGQVRLQLKRPGQDLSITLTRNDNEKNVTIFAHILARR